MFATFRILIPTLILTSLFCTSTYAADPAKTDPAKKVAKKAIAKEAVKGKKAPALNVKEKTVNVVMVTTLGTVEIELNNEKAPISVKNFLNYVDRKYYDGTVFHRVIKDFMAQGGGFDKDLKKRPTDAAVKNEATNGLKNDLGTVAMARTNVVDSGTSQFYINLKDNEFLNHKNTSAQGYGYAVFGKVVGGMEVVNKMAAAQTTSSQSLRDVPKVPIIITTLRRKIPKN